MKKLALLALTLTGLTAQAHAATPLQAAIEQYVKIQTALAADSLKGVPEAANAIAAAVQESGGALPDTAASQAQAVAKAPDIKAARAAFKPLSATLITALSSQKEKTGHY